MNGPGGSGDRRVTKTACCVTLMTPLNSADHPNESIRKAAGKTRARTAVRRPGLRVFVATTYPFFLPFEAEVTDVVSPGPRQFG